MRKLSSVAVFLALTGCGARYVSPEGGSQPPSSDVPAPFADAQPSTDVVPPAMNSFVYVIDSLTIDPTDNPDTPHSGFDLDGLFSSDIDPLGCAHGDFFSIYDDDQNCITRNEMCAAMPNLGCARGGLGCRGGVDNQLPTIANTFQTAFNSDVRASLERLIDTNHFALLVRVEGIDDFSNDPNVRVSMYVGFPTFGANCSSVMVDREYSVAAASLVDGASSADGTARVSGNGSIVRGRLDFVAPQRDVPLAIPLIVTADRPPAIAPVRAIHFRANITPMELGNGSLGGILRGEDLLADVQAVAPEYTAVIRGVIDGLVDIRIDDSCASSNSSPPRYGGIGMGYTPHGIRARLSASNPIAATPAAGTCGAM